MSGFIKAPPMAFPFHSLAFNQKEKRASMHFGDKMNLNGPKILQYFREEWIKLKSFWR